MLLLIVHRPGEESGLFTERDMLNFVFMLLIVSSTVFILDPAIFCIIIFCITMYKG